jgi:hypothetical protein
MYSQFDPGRRDRAEWPPFLWLIGRNPASEHDIATPFSFVHFVSD